MDDIEFAVAEYLLYWAVVECIVVIAVLRWKEWRADRLGL